MASYRIRPLLQIRFGRINEPVRIPHTPLVVDALQTFLTANTIAAVGAVTVKNTTGFTINQILLLGEPGNQGSEVMKSSATVAPTSSQINFTANTVYPHSSGTKVYNIGFDQVEISSSPTVLGTKTVLVTTVITPGLFETVYNDTSGTTGFYFARFKNSITAGFSPYSDGVPVAGYGLTMARSIINNALQGINKEITKDVITDEFAFSEIDNCQTEVLRELKRWSFMQKFDFITTQTATGTWYFPLPVDVDDQNTNKSIFKIRLGRQQELIWVDKEKFDEFVGQTAYTTLNAKINIGDTTITLANSNDFGDSGSVSINSNTYAFTANNRTTGVLTMVASLTTDAAAGATTYATTGAVFLGPQSGNPQYWTTYGGKVYYWPVTDATRNKRNIYMDYYASLTPIVTDSDKIVLPDVTLVQYYLQWKFLRRINNGNETEGSLECKKNYLDRRDRLKQKEVMNKNFVLRPRYQNFAIRSQFNSNDSRKIRDGNFPNA